ncbi:MAG TPA: hypothetical protein VHZ55_08285 [Bryobacteraceae bacterium]|nr:hypothetical protein [Bryobacteraceae bacterium]
MKLLLVFLMMVLPLTAEIIDRVAIAIGYQVITASAIDEELRVTALLNGKPIRLDESARRDAADRLVQQFLIRRDMLLSRYTVPDAADVDAYSRAVEQELGDPNQLAALLRQYGLSEAILREHLALQLTTLRFVEFRFRPDLNVSDSDIQAYIQRQHLGDSVNKNRVRQAIVEERTDAALNAWLEGARKRANIVYFDKTLQ